MDTVPGPVTVPDSSLAPAAPSARVNGTRQSLPVAVWLIAVAAYALELAVSSRYGYDRDELYFLVAGQHWLWGPPPADDTTVVAIGVDPSTLRATFTSVRQVAVYTNGLGISNLEEGTPVYVATGPRVSWAAAWPAFRHDD